MRKIKKKLRWDFHGLITQKYTVPSQCDYSKISSWKEKKKLLSWLPREMRYLKNYIFLRTSTIPIANHVERVIFDNLILKLHHASNQNCIIILKIMSHCIKVLSKIALHLHASISWWFSMIFNSIISKHGEDRALLLIQVESFHRLFLNLF